MKKLILSITAMCAAVTLNAQIDYDMQLDMISPASGSVVAPGDVSVSFNLLNNGPDAIPAGDTVYFVYTDGTDIFSLTGVVNQASGYILPAAFPVGTAISSTMLGINATLPLSSVADGTDICLVFLGRNSAALTQAGDTDDSDFTNNLDCFEVNSSSSVEENSLSTSVYPNPANDVLNIVSSEKVASVSIISMDGKVAMTTSETSVAVGTLNSGMYIYEVTTTSGNVSRNTFMKN